MIPPGNARLLSQSVARKAGEKHKLMFKLSFQGKFKTIQYKLSSVIFLPNEKRRGCIETTPDVRDIKDTILSNSSQSV